MVSTRPTRIRTDFWIDLADLCQSGSVYTGSIQHRSCLVEPYYKHPKLNHKKENDTISDNDYDDGKILIKVIKVCSQMNWTLFV